MIDWSHMSVTVGRTLGGLHLGATVGVEAQIWANKNGVQHPNKKWGL